MPVGVGVILLAGAQHRHWSRHSVCFGARRLGTATAMALGDQGPPILCPCLSAAARELQRQRHDEHLLTLSSVPSAVEILALGGQMVA